MGVQGRSAEAKGGMASDRTGDRRIRGHGHGVSIAWIHPRITSLRMVLQEADGVRLRAKIQLRTDHHHHTKAIVIAASVPIQSAWLQGDLAVHTKRETATEVEVNPVGQDGIALTSYLQPQKAELHHPRCKPLHQYRGSVA